MQLSNGDMNWNDTRIGTFNILPSRIHCAARTLMKLLPVTLKHQSGVTKHLNNKVCTREKQVSEFKCTHCPAVFPYKSRLDSHLKAHLPPKKCPSCLREFKRKDFFEKHIASCVEDPNFVPSFSVNDQCPESVMTEEETVPAAESHSEIHATPPHVETTKDIVILIPVSIWNRVLSFRCQRRRL